MIRIICPQDPTIRCVERQARRLDRRLGGMSKIYVVKPNDKSKSDCHQKIKSWSEDDIIIFMGHGRSDALFGSRGRNFNAMGHDSGFEVDNPEDYYNDENFIDKSNYVFLKGKSIVCFACETNLLAKKLIDAGAKSVLGFGKMPTSVEEFKSDWKLPYISKKMIAFMNGVLNVSFRDAMIKVVNMGGEIVDIAIYFKMEMRRQISLLLHSKAKYRYDIADVLYKILYSVDVIGDKRTKIL